MITSQFRTNFVHRLFRVIVFILGVYFICLTLAFGHYIYRPNYNSPALKAASIPASPLQPIQTVEPAPPPFIVRRNKVAFASSLLKPSRQKNGALDLIMPLARQRANIMTTVIARRKEHPGILNEVWKELLREMEGYDFSELDRDPLNQKRRQNTRKWSKGMDGLIPAKGGQPVRNLVFATWRSGSTFIGRLLDSHPGVYFHYEPLKHFYLSQVHSGRDAADALQTLHGILACNYTGIPRRQKFTARFYQSDIKERRVYDFCRRRNLTTSVCVDPFFLSNLCKLFPFQALKTVRMRLRLGKILLEDSHPNIRLLLLIRDPRAVMLSRRGKVVKDWCRQGRDCRDSRNLCGDMEEDFIYAKYLKAQFPDRFLVMRYDDISLHPFPAARKIFKFFHLQFHPQVRRFLEQHTKNTVSQSGIAKRPYNVHDSPAKAAFNWMTYFYKTDFGHLLGIQRSCEGAMKKWGYAPVENRSQLVSSQFTPLLKFPLSAE